jgi:hypothetical protein
VVTIDLFVATKQQQQAGQGCQKILIKYQYLRYLVTVQLKPTTPVIVAIATTLTTTVRVILFLATLVAINFANAHDLAAADAAMFLSKGQPIANAQAVNFGEVA